MSTARLVIPALRASSQGGFEHEQGRIAEAIGLGVGGFIIFGGSAERVARLTEQLVKAAGRPLLIGSDVERGAGQQFAGLTEFPPPRALAALDDPDSIASAAAVTAWEARSVGVNWVFAPDADLDLLAENPIVQTRSFGDDPARVAECIRLWVEVCQSAGALACVKHYPGHGRTVTDSHAGLPRVDATADTLAASDERPFEAGIAAGVASVMTAHVAYPALDPSGAPATRSPVIIDHLRRRGFEGLVVTDALIMAGATQGRSETEGVVDAIAAGVDLLLYPHDVPRVVTALAQAERDGRLSAERVASAVARYDHALELATRPAETERHTLRTAAWMADKLIAEGLMRGPVGPLRLPIELSVVDDDVGGPYPPGPSDWVARALSDARIAHGRSGSCITLVFSEPRGWKGRGGLGGGALGVLHGRKEPALTVLFGHPRIIEQLPSRGPVLVAWHRQRLMQEAVARWIVTRLHGHVSPPALEV